MRVRDGSAIRSWRRQRRFSQDDLAALCRCSQNTISLIESGRLPSLSVELAVKLAGRLEVPVEVLFEERQQTGPRRAPLGTRRMSAVVNGAGATSQAVA